MNLKEAYKTLEIPEGSTPEEAKKKYRELSKKLHPDVNKDPGAEAKFKKVNEAYDCVKNGKGNDREPPPSYGHQPPGWSPFGGQQKVVQLEHVEIKLTIDFKESVLGCKREVKYQRKVKCPDCSGEGETRLNNGCTKCGGKGQVTTTQRGMVFVQTCPQCGGRAQTEDCKSCNGDGTSQADVSVHVSVPAGVMDGNTLRLQGMGNFAGSVMGIMDRYTDAYCHITVKSEPGLAIEGKDVVSNLELDLLDAIRGCKRNVNTINGVKEIRVPALSRHNDEVIIPHCGVSGVGNQRVLLDVQYPKDTTKLVGVLLDEVI